MADRIEGKVAQVLNEQEVIINRGTKHGVSQGMRFGILADTPLQVKDPDTGEVLGTIDREKVRIEAREVLEKIAICRTFETYVVGGALAASTFANIFGSAKEFPRTFKVKDPGFIPTLSEEESYVNVGDRVRQTHVQETEGAD